MLKYCESVTFAMAKVLGKVKKSKEKLEAARKQNKVAESKKTDSTEELLRKKIMEKLEVSRKKKAIQERIKNLKEKK